MKTINTAIQMGLSNAVLNELPGTEKISAGMGKAAGFLPSMMGMEMLQMTKKKKW